MEILQDGENRVALFPREGAYALPIFEVRQESRARVRLGAERGLRLGLLLHLVVAALELLHVGEDELRLDDFRVADGVDGGRLVAALLDVDDVVVLEAPHDVEDGVALADVREELVAETLALRGALHETRDVGELHGRPDYLLWIDDFREFFETGIGHFDYGRVRLDGAERIILRRRLLTLRQRVEQCGLPYVGKPDDTYAKAHFDSFVFPQSGYILLSSER